MKEYIVLYILGKNSYKICVEAHDKEQAGYIAEMQVKYRHNSKAKLNIVSVLEKGEIDPGIELAEKMAEKWLDKIS